MSDRSATCFLGVDGGASKTIAVVVDATGKERGRGMAGSANQEAVGVQEAVRQIRAAVDQALGGVGGEPPARAAWLGLAGVDRPDDRDVLLPHLRPLAESVRLTNDAELVLTALDGGCGVALIAGTGSIALGRDTHGTSTRAGGWGHVLGDEGSGYAIGRLALRAAVRAADGRGRPSVLLPMVLRHWELGDASEILGRVYPDLDKSEIARLAALVLGAARAGDVAARRIVLRAASELALAVQAASNRLDFPDGLVPLALGGGLLIHEPDFQTRVLRAIRRRVHVGRVVVVADPALSAARAATALAGSLAGEPASGGAGRTPVGGQEE